MNEVLINSEDLQRQAMEIVHQLKRAAENQERTFPTKVQAVLVFSGPGTYYSAYKPGQEKTAWKRWMDRDRIRAGVAVLSDITAAKISEISGKESRPSAVTRNDLQKLAPFLVYNGLPLENEVFYKAVHSDICKIPEQRVVLIREVIAEDGSSHPILHTGDQVKSFYQELLRPESVLNGITNLGLVAHMPDFIRIPFYMKKYDDEFKASGHQGLKVWIYALRSRPGTEQPHIDAELQRLVKYAQQGDLATEPIDFSV